MIWLIATASRTLVCFSSGFRTPRSANTFPELATAPGLSFRFAIPLLIVRPGLVEASRRGLFSIYSSNYPSSRISSQRQIAPTHLLFRNSPSHPNDQPFPSFPISRTRRVPHPCGVALHLPAAARQGWVLGFSPLRSETVDC